MKKYGQWNPHRKSSHEKRRNQLSQRGDFLMFAADKNFKITVLKELFKRFGETAAHQVSRLGCMNVHDLLPRLGQTEIEIVVLIARKSLIEHSNFIKNR